MHGMYGALGAELEVQRTIKRAEVTAFLCLFRKTVGPTTRHVDNKGTIDGLWRGEASLAQTVFIVSVELKATRNREMLC